MTDKKGKDTQPLPSLFGDGPGLFSGGDLDQELDQVFNELDSSDPLGSFLTPDLFKSNPTPPPNTMEPKQPTAPSGSFLAASLQSRIEQETDAPKLIPPPGSESTSISTLQPTPQATEIPSETDSSKLNPPPHSEKLGFDIPTSFAPSDNKNAPSDNNKTSPPSPAKSSPRKTTLPFLTSPFSASYPSPAKEESSPAPPASAPTPEPASTLNTMTSFSLVDKPVEETQRTTSTTAAMAPFQFQFDTSTQSPTENPSSTKSEKKPTFTFDTEAFPTSPTESSKPSTPPKKSEETDENRHTLALTAEDLIELEELVQPEPKPMKLKFASSFPIQPPPPSETTKSPPPPPSKASQARSETEELEPLDLLQLQQATLENTALLDNKSTEDVVAFPPPSPFPLVETANEKTSTPLVRRSASQKPDPTEALHVGDIISDDLSETSVTIRETNEGSWDEKQDENPFFSPSFTPHEHPTKTQEPTNTKDWQQAKPSPSSEVTIAPQQKQNLKATALFGTDLSEQLQDLIQKRIESSDPEPPVATDSPSPPTPAFGVEPSSNENNSDELFLQNAAASTPRPISEAPKEPANTPLSSNMKSTMLFGSDLSAQVQKALQQKTNASDTDETAPTNTANLEDIGSTAFDAKLPNHLVEIAQKLESDQNRQDQTIQESPEQESISPQYDDHQPPDVIGNLSVDAKFPFEESSEKQASSTEESPALVIPNKSPITSPASTLLFGPEIRDQIQQLAESKQAQSKEVATDHEQTSESQETSHSTLLDSSPEEPPSPLATVTLSTSVESNDLPPLELPELSERSAKEDTEPPSFQGLSDAIIPPPSNQTTERTAIPNQFDAPTPSPHLPADEVAPTTDTSKFSLASPTQSVPNATLEFGLDLGPQIQEFIRQRDSQNERPTIDQAPSEALSQLASEPSAPPPPASLLSSESTPFEDKTETPQDSSPSGEFGIASIEIVSSDSATDFEEFSNANPSLYSETYSPAETTLEAADSMKSTALLEANIQDAIQDAVQQRMEEKEAAPIGEKAGGGQSFTSPLEPFQEEKAGGSSQRVHIESDSQMPVTSPRDSLFDALIMSTEQATPEQKAETARVFASSQSANLVAELPPQNEVATQLRLDVVPGPDELVNADNKSHDEERHSETDSDSPEGQSFSMSGDQLDAYFDQLKEQPLKKFEPTTEKRPMSIKERSAETAAVEGHFSRALEIYNELQQEFPSESRYQERINQIWELMQRTPDSGVAWETFSEKQTSTNSMDGIPVTVVPPTSPMKPAATQEMLNDARKARSNRPSPSSSKPKPKKNNLLPWILIFLVLLLGTFAILGFVTPGWFLH